MLESGRRPSCADEARPSPVVRVIVEIDRMEQQPQQAGRCPDCAGEMVAGTLMDYRRGTVEPSEWVEGGLSTSVWTGRVRNEKRYEVTAFRCAQCGLLKLYAATPATAPDRTV
jgi:hypothetical protein